MRLNAVVAGARGQCCWESCSSKHSCKRELCGTRCGDDCGYAQVQALMLAREHAYVCRRMPDDLASRDTLAQRACAKLAAA